MPKMIGNVLNWASEVDEGTLEQASRVAGLPFVSGHVALMPDAHFGYGCTVGSVIPLRNALIPSAVGVDIGCGMIASHLDLTAEQLPDDLRMLHAQFGKAIPAGVGQHGGEDSDIEPASFLTEKQAKKAGQQMGSLGSGNHFVEVCLDELGGVWIVLHSGSRGIGKELADIATSKAKGLMKKFFIDLPDDNLAYLPRSTPEYYEYVEMMIWAQDYAMANRRTMMDAAVREFEFFMGRHLELVETINCHHNYAAREQHGGHTVWVTRKGAIRARKGDKGVIPGSMGTSTFIVEGLGNPSSYDSCSHGAGRRMSRKSARTELDVDTLVDQMEGIAWNSQNPERLIDEDPRAYKDVNRVMEDQQDLVSIVHTLTQVLNYKGA